MPGAPKQPERQSVSAGEVRAFLLANPAFLADNSDLLGHLVPPEFRRGENVLDLQNFMLTQMRGELAHVQLYQAALVNASRGNMASQRQVHEAVLCLVAAHDLAGLIGALGGEMLDLLQLDGLVLALEAASAPAALCSLEGVRLLPAGAVDGRLGRNHDVALGDSPPGGDDIFGPAASLVRSQALVRLTLAPPGRPEANGLLALGSRNEDHFHDGQGTDLLRFLGAVLERRLMQCLSPE